VPDTKATSYEVGLVVPKGIRPESYADVVSEIGELILERFFDEEIRPAPGQLIDSKALQQHGAQDKSHLSTVLLGWSVWLPENIAWDQHAELGPLAILDLIPLTSGEADLYQKNVQAFEAGTQSGEIDLLDFARG